MADSGNRVTSPLKPHGLLMTLLQALENGQWARRYRVLILAPRAVGMHFVKDTLDVELTPSEFKRQLADCQAGLYSFVGTTSARSPQCITQLKSFIRHAPVGTMGMFEYKGKEDDKLQLKRFYRILEAMTDVADSGNLLLINLNFYSTKLVDLFRKRGCAIWEAMCSLYAQWRDAISASEKLCMARGYNGLAWGYGSDIISIASSKEIPNASA